MMQRFVAFGLIWLATPALAHPFDPGLLQIEEKADQTQVTWNVPVAWTSASQSVSPEFPEHCTLQWRGQCQARPGRRCGSFLLRCETPGLWGQKISFSGLSGSDYTVIVSLSALTLDAWTGRAQGSMPHVNIPRKDTDSSGQTLWRYLGLGVTHILGGWDHLLFVLGLMLIISGTRPLVLTITAFTVGHSITLCCAALGWVNAPSEVIEATIAMSLVLLAVEAMDSRPTWTRRFPWGIAFLFGLLHGFGFGGALVDIGLVKASVPLALGGFNLGVELGQLVFVAAILLLAKLPWVKLQSVSRGVAYAIGIVGVALSFERIAAMVSLQ